MRARLAFSLTVLSAALARAGDLKKPVRLEAGGAPIDVEVGHAAPLVVDLDGDRSCELLVGQFGDGKLRIYPIRETKSKSQPRLGDMRWFEADGQVGSIPAS
ncbi:MAG: hypothetical protein HYR85_21910 [Planctomycetes bacterium]|nr:hypothetical protein [Planctomycetota bacterium]